MDIPTYRKRYEAELAEAEKRPSTFQAQKAKSKPGRTAGRRVGLVAARAGGQDDVTEAVAILDDAREDDKDLRIAAVQAIAKGVREHPELLDRLLAILRDIEEPVDVRIAAMSALQQVQISAPRLVTNRPAYLETLRSIIDDADATLRRRAIATLAREKDPYVQQRLLDGMIGRSKALVPVSKAIQFLGYDIHAIPSGLLRDIVDRPPNPAAKREAVRVLAADPASTDVLARLFQDKGERSEVRRIAAVGLQSLAPEQFEAIARRIILDKGEDEELRATCLSALTLTPGSTRVSEDADITRSVRQLEGSSTSSAVKRATRTYMSKQTR